MSRAPGYEKEVDRLVGYEEKRLLASRAILDKPHGEERTPTRAWSGLGFSSSMPEAVLR